MKQSIKLPPDILFPYLLCRVLHPAHVLFSEFFCWKSAHMMSRATLTLLWIKLVLLQTECVIERIFKGNVLEIIHEPHGSSRDNFQNNNNNNKTGMVFNVYFSNFLVNLHWIDLPKDSLNFELFSWTGNYKIQKKI